MGKVSISSKEHESLLGKYGCKITVYIDLESKVCHFYFQRREIPLLTTDPCQTVDCKIYCYVEVEENIIGPHL